MISVEHLTKYYGDHLAVDDISFEIEGNHVYGFLGPNGAGKSTIMNIMTGCLSAGAGRVRIGGHDIYEEPDEAKRCIGYLPEQPPLYMNDSPAEYLQFVGEAKGFRGQDLSARISEVMERVGIFGVKDRRISALSKGYRQRVGIAQALLGDPEIIILDEPTVGLDPIQIMEIRELIAELGKTRTVVFSSHILSEVQAICDKIIMIANGRLVAFGEPEELRKQLLAPGEILLTTDASEKELQDILGNTEHLAGITAETSGSGYITAHIQSDSGNLYALSADLFRRFASSDRVIYEMTLSRGNLEDIFLELSETGAAEPETASAEPVSAEKAEEESGAEKT